ncbi:IspD/TarI family cytidylyltransferase [Anaerocolumna chitinilytica]|uniref:2-C-methyl-D-erythritol 4-phosphate cytidylyltransferase n=1 Tax=Anaerocolumna chitinilytica TaxID=1727145 RepID=A0A7M3S9F1_9FIRM|nr:2-C-methyl-D-erythritol 4-phosphate cytidylyltransferase [Anaerocolumna chitinilytica]BCK01219.1 2-C-methyl-D-erythritol 4-phosphate cytidylyltransferase [Anaerocolumna chitinilytica]
MNIALILSGGISTRFESGLPKQYNELNCKEVIAYTIEALKQSSKIDGIIISANAAYVEQLSKRYSVEVITGGTTRNQSLRNGLEYIKLIYPECENVFIHEAARPFITPDLVDNYFTKLDEYDAVITTQHITDSLGSHNEAVTDRSLYYLVQAPEAFKFDLLYKYFDADSLITATAQQLPPDSKIYKNFDFRHNLKITYPEDLTIAEALMRYLNDKNSRT